MDSKTFEKLTDKQFDRCRDILCTKATEYATEDRLHNFHVAAELLLNAMVREGMLA